MLTWCPKDRSLTIENKRGRFGRALRDLDARVFDALWNARGEFVADEAIAAHARTSILEMQNAIGRLNGVLRHFDCFIVSHRPSPRHYQFISDEFRADLSTTATQPAPPANSGAEPVPAAVSDNFSLGGRVCQDNKQNCSNSPP